MILLKIAKPKRTWVEIDPNALRTNLYYAREQAEGADVMAVVKADAYGHGFAETIKALDSEVSAFGVATLNEALAVMSVTKKTTDIMILGALLPDEREDAVIAGLHVTISSLVEAKEYNKEWKGWRKLSAGQKKEAKMPHKDLDLECLLEIIKDQREITCHSYRQSEINMLMQVADSIGFTLNTFTHILEGYKVAEKMKAHGVGASTFSDWWAYKYEVNDAIPHNGALLNDMGIVTAFNSDDAEMARRLNQEAAKAVKYGGTTEEEAWKFITLNPAKLLHIDDKAGSLKKGKDADVVLWSAHPMSVYSIAEQTYVDGRLYYSLELDQENRLRNAEERNRLTQKMLAEKNNGKATQKIKKERSFLFHCDD